jgi:allophanate hydrolase subunit 2
VGNDPRAAAIEIPLGPLTARAVDGVAVSVDGEDAVELPDGGEFVVPACDRAVRYLAARGGFDVPLVLGARATLAVAGLGGFEGRPLRAGDRLAVETTRFAPRAASSVVPTVTDPPDGPTVLRVLRGPHLSRFPDGALEQFLSTTWRVSPHSDRVGVRLEGAGIARRGDDRAPPAPMVRGAVQVTTDGTPIVLGPDHPVTGGYPVIAVVGRASQAILARLRAQREVRFALVDRP